MNLAPSVKKFKKIVSQGNMVVLGVNNPNKKDSIAYRWGKLIIYFVDSLYV